MYFTKFCDGCNVNEYEQEEAPTLVGYVSRWNNTFGLVQ